MASSPRILIATPCYGGSIAVAYFKSMMRAFEKLREAGIEYLVLTKSNESLITRARNTFVAEFLGRQQFTHLLFIDADIGFDPEVILKMLRYDRAVTAAPCPMKGILWDRVYALASRARDGAHLRDLSMMYNVNFVDADDKPVKTTLSIDNGFIQVPVVGTGFMMIRRDVLDIMRAKLPDCRYQNDVAGYDNEFTRGNFHTFFDTMIHPKSGRYLSEDYAFCYRWVHQCGGEIHLNLECRITHFGNYAFSGAFSATGQMPAV